MANAESKLKIVVEADDKTGKGLSGANKNLGFLQKDVSGLSKALAGATVAAGGLAVAFGISAIKSYSDTQAGLARIDAILNTMSDSAKKNRQAILDASQAAIKLGFDDDKAAESITKFYQKTNDLNKALELNQFAMDVARYKNIDLESATTAVNGALAGNVRLLKELGIVTDETLSPLEAIAEAQRVVKGQADSFASTFSGQMAIMTEAWANMKDEIGKVLVEALLPYAKLFNEWVTNPETKKAFAEWTADFKSWADVIIPTVVDVFKLWLGVAEKIYNIMLKIGEAIITATNAAYEFAKTNVKSSIVGKAISLITGKASGGPVSGGTPYIVGEKGPELFVPSGNGSIIPNNKMGGGSITVNINGGYYLSEEVAEDIGDKIISRLQLSNAF